VQDARKLAGLDISDRIKLRVEAQGDTAEAVAKWRDFIMGETLALDLNGKPFTPSYETAPDGLRIVLARAR